MRVGLMLVVVQTPINRQLTRGIAGQVINGLDQSLFEPSLISIDFCFVKSSTVGACWREVSRIPPLPTLCLLTPPGRLCMVPFVPSTCCC